MTIERILTTFKKRGYQVVRCWSNASNDSVVVTPRNGFSKSFTSYAAAYRYYFGS